jgi:hypothetical protein
LAQGLIKAVIQFLVLSPQLVVAMVVKVAAAQTLRLLVALAAVVALEMRLLVLVRLELVVKEMLVAHLPALLQTTHQAAVAVQAQ